MKLKEISINNYKGIINLNIKFNQPENKCLLGFLGINESGKSNLLKSISMKDNLSEFNYNDYISKEKKGETIKVIYKFDISKEELFKLLTKKFSEIPSDFINKVDILALHITSKIEKDKTPINEVNFEFKNNEIDNWEKDNEHLVKEIKPKEDGTISLKDPLNLNKLFNENISNIIISESPKIIFWKSEDKYLMNKEIPLNSFKLTPKKISIPLKNCFLLAKISENDINQKIDEILSNPTEQKNFIDKLDKKVTQFINKVWPEHKIRVGFEIQSNLITFMVKNIDGDYERLNSRSDGLRQFISFLLSSSAEVETGQLDNSILLIDEPETHLHPTAQEYLLKEFIKISKNNIVMFATHSSYLIDKENFSNYYRVYKKDNFTEIKKFDNNNTSFSEINYSVFNICTTDYHNELYGWCEMEKKSKLNNLEKTKSYKKQKPDGSFYDPINLSLTDYVRHQIHHPENEENPRFTDEELKESINILRGIKYQ